ncbi:DUF72 domain-containing protein [Paractinoplanes globisporus]|uniref:DUF72 domain-containing protein n=1 Tax=Paractinoplanes globisporus TaxID=113565 RepID=A0ABW6WSH0_9ACTN|nr:DUF72 domain-containing protein [Actinoplanes globisporus]
MWSLKSWQGRFVGRALPAGERLRAYAGWCTAVEGNTTFYATPARETVASWAAQTDPSFRFVLKLPQTVTHTSSGFTGVDLAGFWHAMEPLGPRAHAFWIQLPGSFGPDGLGALAGFLRRLPPDFRYAVEVRHRAFFDDPGPLTAVLAKADVEWVPFDTTAFFASPPASDAEREAWTKKPRMPLRTEALTARPIIRYLGRDDTAATVAGWQRWIPVVAQWLREGRSPTVFLHTPDNADAPGLARRFHDEVRAVVPSLSPLPSPAPPASDTLF